MRISLRSPTSSGMSIASRVVPASSETITRSSPRKRLTSEDLPTFGRPITARRTVSASGSLIACRQQLDDPVEQISRAESLCSGHGERIAESEPVELGRQRHLGDAVALVRRHDARQRRASQQIGELLVAGPHAGARVDDQHRHLRVRQSRARLLADRAGERVVVLEVHPAGIDQLEPASVPLALELLAVARHARDARARPPRACP